MKALILAAGKAVRLSQHLNSYPKCMLRIGDKPIAQFSLDNAVDAGTDELVLVVASLNDEIVEFFGSSHRGVPIRYVVQHERKGLVHAMECAASSLNGDNFMLFLADELMYEPRHKDMIETFNRDGAYVICGVVQQQQSSEICKTYSVLHHPGDKKIYRLVEKPRHPVNSLQGTGNLVFRGAILDYLPITPINPIRGERDLTDLVQCAIDDGHKVYWFEIATHYVNINEPEDIRKIETAFGNSVYWPGM